MKLRYMISTLVILTLVCLLSGCDAALLNPAGTIAAAEKKLLIEAVLLMLIVVIPVILLSFLIAYRYRASNTKAMYSPNWCHSNLIEVVCWGIPCIIIVILAVMTWVYTHRLDPYKPLGMKGKPITIEAIALDWRWLFIYPEQHVATINLMQIPANREIQLLVTSDNAPMNSIEIPQLAGQIYAMTGMQTKLHFNALKPGDYRGLSTNYSGDGFAGMMFTVRATSDAGFNAWVKQAQSSVNHLSFARYNQITMPSTDGKVMIFSAVDKDLYNKIMMRYMPGSTVATPAPSKPSEHAASRKALKNTLNNHAK